MDVGIGILVPYLCSIIVGHDPLQRVLVLHIPRERRVVFRRVGVEVESPTFLPVGWIEIREHAASSPAAWQLLDEESVRVQAAEMYPV